MNISLSGKTAIVCGSTQGIGKAIAIELASMGAGITAVARNEIKLKELMGALPSDKEQKHNYFIADFSHPRELESELKKHLDQNPAPDILINNTGGPPAGQAIDASIDAFVSAFSNHVVCNQILAQHVVPGMKEKGYGRIINIISTSVKEPIKGLGVSNTTRGAVASWAKTLANELGQFGITVNNVLPGFTNTDRLSSLLSNKAKKAGKTNDEVVQDSKSIIPAGRFADPEEIAYAVAFLSSPSASYINGINLPVDGGRIGSL